MLCAGKNDQSLAGHPPRIPRQLPDVFDSTRIRFVTLHLEQG